MKNESYRMIMTHKNTLSVKTVRKTMVLIIYMTEKDLLDEMKAAGCERLIHDGWSKFRMNYLGLFVSYLVERLFLAKHGRPIEKNVHKVASLAPPLHKIQVDKDFDNVEDRWRRKRDTDAVITFTAQAHKDQIDNAMAHYIDCEIVEWGTHQTCSSVSFNEKLARLLVMPMVNCHCRCCTKDSSNRIVSRVVDYEGVYGLQQKFCSIVQVH